MAKVAIIGAGSIVFCKTLMLDILATPGLQETEFALMAPSTGRTSQVEEFANRVIKGKWAESQSLEDHRPPRSFEGRGLCDRHIPGGRRTGF